MSNKQIGKVSRVSKCFLLLLLLIINIQFTAAQTHKKGFFKKLSDKVHGKKDDAAKSEAAPTADSADNSKKDTKSGETAKNADDTKPAPAKGRLPVIVIPGLIGSELINKVTNDKVWFSLGRAKDDDVRLPISPDLKANKDNLVPGDILRKIQIIKLAPDVEIYQKLINSLVADGFTEGKIDAPAAGDATDTFYVFAYDWRLDNVENAQILIKKMDAIRAATKKPSLKFNVIAHSMGGLITRYIALYGNSDLTERRTRPVWKGAQYFNSVSLVASPNGGALSSLDSLLNGFSLFGNGKINLPFVQNLSRYDLFTIPSIYQLLPHTGKVRAFDENLRPIKINIYDPAVWEKYNWTTYTQDDFAKKVDNATPEQAKEYFRAVLHRADLFQTALDARPVARSPIPFYYLGAGCKDTVDGMIIRKDPKKGFWETDFGAADFVTAGGVKVTSKQTEKLMIAPGDGVVTEKSLISTYDRLGALRNKKSKIVINGLTKSCDEHNRLTGNLIVDKVILSVLNNKAITDVPKVNLKATGVDKP